VHILKKPRAPRCTRPEGITSYLLASPRTSQAKHLTTHGIRNAGKDSLRYFTAAVPSFDTSDLLELWPLASESEDLGDGRLQS
jgi:hypothetical protein